MGSRSIPVGRTSALDILRSIFSRLAGLSRGRIWARSTRRLRLCETLSLGNRGYLAVVRYDRQHFLLGGSGNSIALLAQLSAASSGDPENVEDDDPAQ